MRVSSSPSSSALASPAVINPVEARWAADAVASLARQLDPDSIVSVILRRSQRELASLAINADTPREEKVIGPVRVRMAA